jgi:DNA-binding LacI/PurR family transcriptional regulator
MAPTIQDVARAAGVGVGTVSRVLNNSPKVDPATRERVLRAIAELDYVPSPIARRLSTGRTGAIGVVAPYFTAPAAVERLRGIEAALSETTYDLVAFNIETPERRRAVLSSLARRGRIDGLIIITLSPTAEEVGWLERSGIPTVLVDGYHRRLSRVVVDDVRGGRLATEHLIALGHRRIAYIGNEPRWPFRFSSSRLRYWGYLQALRAAGITPRADYVRIGPHERELARRHAHELFALPERPTGIVCATDTKAAAVLGAAREAGLAVPDQLSVVGYDDIEIAGYLGLTTVRQNLFESGRRGAQILLAALEGAEMPPRREVVPVEVVVRNTTASPPAEEGN